MLSNGGHMNAHTRFVPMLAALLAVLTLASSSARAGCAWVLWRVDHDVQRTLHVAFDASETKQQCDVERQQLAEKAADVINRGGPFFGFICLPDTVDPRGPKGSGR
jgi:hypothetical protein